MSEFSATLAERGSRWKRRVDRLLGIPLLFPATLWRWWERPASPPEYPHQVTAALRQFGTPFAALPDPLSPMERIMNTFDITTFMRNLHEIAYEHSTCSLRHIFSLHGDEFVCAAYHKVLYREPDETGLTQYRPRAVSIWGKARILLSLYLSPEKNLIASGLRRLGANLVTLYKSFRPALTPPRDMDAFYFEFESRYRDDFEAILARLHSRYVEPLAVAPRGPALDMGCGRGEGVALLASLGFQAVGVDSNRYATAFAREKGLTVHTQDMFAYLRTVPDASQAVVTAFHVIEHLPFERLWDMLDEVRRVLQPGGLLLLETPNIRNLLVTGGDFYRDPTHVRPVFPDTLNFLVSRCGFEGQSFFFRQDETLIPEAESRFEEIQDYFHVSRDMVWRGCKKVNPCAA